MAKGSAPTRSSSRLLTRAAAAPPPRALNLPPEILAQIFADVTAYDIPADDEYVDTMHEDSIAPDRASARNGQLAALALVAKAWRGPAYSALYGDLRVVWLAGNVDKLVASFDDNADLLPLVRRLEVFGRRVNDLLEERIHEAMMLVEDEAIEDLMQRTGKDYSAADDEWRASAGLHYIYPNPGFRDVAEPVEEVLREAGHDAWMERDDDAWGSEELFDLLEKAPNLDALVVPVFAWTVPAHLLQRGPFGFTSLETGDPGALAFDAGGPLFGSFLAARAPGLRHLKTPVPEELDEGPPTPLAALTTLEIDGSDFQGSFSPAVVPTLRRVHSSLRSFAYTTVGDVEWGAPIAPFLSTLSSLDLTATEYGESENLSTQTTAISPSISESTSLRHLRLAVIFLGPIRDGGGFSFVSRGAALRPSTEPSKFRCFRV
ncbi:hypothetical protein RQP46_009896 [Phenoliferia psychrophenolica]